MVGMDHEFRDVVEHLRAYAGEAIQAELIYEGDRHRDGELQQVPQRWRPLLTLICATGN